MKTEQLNLRLERDLVSELELIAETESLDRATVIRRLLRQSIKDWRTQHALADYGAGRASLERAAEDAGLSTWEMIQSAKDAGITYPWAQADITSQLAAVDSWVRDASATSFSKREEPSSLPDIPPKPGGVLVIGINPAPVSVAAGHYYQGRLGRRLWSRLGRLGLLQDAIPGMEDEAFTRAGNGLTDLVKRPTRRAAELTTDELREGVEDLKKKITQWKPGLILFPFKKVAEVVFGDKNLQPGPGPSFSDVPTWLLTGPYAATALAESNDRRLRTELKRIQS